MNVTHTTGDYMTPQEIEKRYRSVVRKSRPRSGATWQRVKEKSTKIESGSAYWDYVHLSTAPGEDNEFKECASANPDGLGFVAVGDPKSLALAAEFSAEVTVRVRKLLELSKQILTTQQYNVFIMLAVKEPHLTEREIAKVLNITPGRVHQLWVKAQTKLQGAYDKRTA